MAGRLGAASLTHVGDRADADFDLGRDKTIRLNLQAREAGGGALAGALGLAPEQPFFVTASASGTTSQGQFQVTSRSGALVPIAADGAWTPQGGQANGRIVLASSKYLTWYQHWLGPDLRFQISGARAADGLQDITLKTTSENIDVSTRGEADFGRQVIGPKGVAAILAARQAQRILGWPQMGAARMNGTLTGRADRWTLAGVLEADDPNGFDYKLAQVRGPTSFQWGGGQLQIQATLDGSGGAGHGLVAALLGGRPHAAAQLVWLPDGHVLIKSLAVVGPGLKVDATGQRGMLGGLSFKGQASFTNFAVAHAGAKGLMTTSWTATQSGRDPWLLGFDAKAKGFASGWGEADHLLGDAPTLKGEGAWGARHRALRHRSHWRGRRPDRGRPDRRRQLPGVEARVERHGTARHRAAGDIWRGEGLWRTDWHARQSPRRPAGRLRGDRPARAHPDRRPRHREFPQRSRRHQRRLQPRRNQPLRAGQGVDRLPLHRRWPRTDWPGRRRWRGARRGIGGAAPGRAVVGRPGRQRRPGRIPFARPCVGTAADRPERRPAGRTPASS